MSKPNENQEKRLTCPALSIVLAEKDGKKEAPEWIQIFKAGLYHHPYYGSFELGESFFKSIEENFDKKTYGQEIMLDYGHASHMEAAGWITKVKSEGGKFYGKVDWTPKGKERVEAGEYKYISGDWSENYTDRESLKEHGPVLFGAGLTNRPFIKRMDSVIQLSEGKQGDEEMMTPEEKKQLQDLVDGQKTLSEKVSGLETENKDLKAQLSVSEEKAVKLAEEKAISEKKAGFDKLLADGKAVEAQREHYMSGDMVKYAELAGQPHNPAPAGKSVTETKGAGVQASDLTPEQAEDKLCQLAEELSKSEKISLSDASKRVARENADLVKKRDEKFQ